MRRLPLCGALIAAVALSGCSVFRGAEADVAGPGPGLAAPVRIADLQAEVDRLTSENSRLQRRLTELQRQQAAGGQAAAAGETVAAELPPAPELIDVGRDAVGAFPLKPETVVAAADADTALRDAPAKPVDSSPRLVQPSFASEEETVFENEAAGVIKTASVLYGVHLASYRHGQEARIGWRKLQRENPDELGLLEPRLEEVAIEGRGIFLRLIGGGFSSPDTAAALCAKLKSRDVYCAVTGFAGEPLSLAETR